MTCHVRGASARETEGATTHAFGGARVAPAMNSGALAMNGALAVNALTVQRRLARPMRGAYDLAKLQPVVVRNFSPAFAGIVHCYDVVKALARSVSQQVCSLQFTITESRRRPLGL